jgi:hypothetical protein
MSASISWRAPRAADGYAGHDEYETKPRAA